MISSLSAMTRSVLIARLAYAIARGDDEEEACDNRYDDRDSSVSGRGVILLAVFFSSSAVAKVAAKTRRKSALPCRNSYRGSSMTHASMGLIGETVSMVGVRRHLHHLLILEHFARRIHWFGCECAVWSQI